ncbi:MAG: ATP-binding protein [Acidimicrobiales bacterium]
MSVGADPDLLDLLPDAVFVLDAERVVLAANAAAAGLTGHPVCDLVGADCAALLHPRGEDGRALWASGWHRSSALRSVRLIPEQQVKLRRADGRDVATLVTGAYQRDAANRLTGVTVVARDAHRRMHRLATGIEIVSTVSHELRSPLTSVKGYTSLLLNRWDRLSSEQAKMMLEQVNHDADRVTRLITELLDISRLESGRLVLRRQPVDLAELAESVLDKVRMEYAELEASVEFPRPFPLAWADPDKVVQVLTNLVENACKYGSLSGLEVLGEADGPEVAVAVRDAGEGIKPEDLAQVFDKFFRRAEGRPTGSGLGLWISRGLVEAHGGRLGVSNLPGRGAEFRFTLPVMDRAR